MPESIKSRVNPVDSHLPQISAGAALALGVITLALAGVAISAYRRNSEARPPDSAARRLAHDGDWSGSRAVAGKTVLINRPKAELFSFWSDFNNLPRFMENIQSVDVQGDRSVWTIAAPAGQTVTVESEITERRENDMLAWRSTGSSQVETAGRISFHEAPAGRGTYVEAYIEYQPPAGHLGRLIAQLFRREPGVQARHELKRFKMLMETGEIATSVRTSANA